jgi:hypothetical protein
MKKTKARKLEAEQWFIKSIKDLAANPYSNKFDPSPEIAHSNRRIKEVRSGIQRKPKGQR